MVAPLPIDLDVLGWSDSLVLMVLALVVFGPHKLPQLGRQIGKLMYEFRKASNDFKFQMEEELRAAEEADRRKRQEEERQKALAAKAAEPAPAPPPSEPSSPYSEDVVYPPATPAPAEQVQADLPFEDSAPRIQPPSTGETIAAARPTGSVTENAPDVSAHIGAGVDADAAESSANGSHASPNQAVHADSKNENHSVAEQTVQHG